MGAKEDLKRKALADEIKAERQLAAEKKSHNERVSLQKLLLRYNPNCDHCGKDVSERWGDSVLVVDRLACLDHVEAVRVAALADNSKGLNA